MNARPFAWGTASSARTRNARSWAKVPLYIFIHPTTEMGRGGHPYRISLQLEWQPRALIAVADGRAQQFAPLAKLSFTPLRPRSAILALAYAFAAGSAATFVSDDAA